MAESGSKKEQIRPDYPVALDVIIFRGKEYQVAGVVQTGRFDKDRYILRDPEDDKVLIKVTGAKFNASIERKKPKSENIYRKDEGVMVMGKLVGGKKEKTKIP